MNGLDFIVPSRKSTRLTGVQLRVRELTRDEVIPVDGLSLPSDRLPQFAAQGVLESFDDFYADPGNETDKLAPAAVTGARYDGTAYGVPVSYTNIMMYVNKDMFAKAGLDYPTTWDEFAAAVPKLTVDKNGDGKPEQYAIALADHATLAMYQPMLWNNGGGVVSEDGKTSMLADGERTHDVVVDAGLVEARRHPGAYDLHRRLARLEEIIRAAAIESDR